MFVIDPSAGTAPFEQLRTQITDAIGDGALAAGARLPPVRRLADDLGIAPGTVARAYRELETSGLIETRGRHGSFVAVQGDAAHRQAHRAALAFAQQIHALRIDVDEALALADVALRTLESESRAR